MKPAATGVPRCANCQHLLPWLIESDADSFQSEIDASVPVVIDFWAPWCGPCRAVTPALERLAGTHAGHVKLVKLNVDDAPEIAARYEVKGIPTLVVAKDGREADRLVGAAPEARIEQWLKPHISSPHP